LIIQRRGCDLGGMYKLLGSGLSFRGRFGVGFLGGLAGRLARRRSGCLCFGSLCGSDFGLLFLTHSFESGLSFDLIFGAQPWQDFGDDTGADRAATFTQREPHSLLDDGVVRELNGERHVITRHNHLDGVRKLNQTGQIGGLEEKLRPVVAEERRAATAFFLGEDIDFAIEPIVGDKRARLAQHLSTKHFLAFQRAQQLSAEKQRTVVKSVKLAVEEDPETLSHQGEAAPEQLQAQVLQSQLSPHELAYQESLIQERESEIREIETGIHELSEIFRDLGTLVHEQGGMIDNIESNVYSVAVDTSGAAEELGTASEYQRKAGRRAACLGLVLIVVVAVVLLAILS